jgi:hypothetical protein
MAQAISGAGSEGFRRAVPLAAYGPERGDRMVIAQAGVPDTPLLHKFAIGSSRRRCPKRSGSFAMPCA